MSKKTHILDFELRAIPRSKYVIVPTLKGTNEPIKERIIHVHEDPIMNPIIQYLEQLNDCIIGIYRNSYSQIVIYVELRNKEANELYDNIYKQFKDVCATSAMMSSGMSYQRYITPANGNHYTEDDLTEVCSCFTPPTLSHLSFYIDHDVIEEMKDGEKIFAEQIEAFKHVIDKILGNTINQLRDLYDFDGVVPTACFISCVNVRTSRHIENKDIYYQVEECRVNDEVRIIEPCILISADTAIQNVVREIFHTAVKVEISDIFHFVFDTEDKQSLH